MDTNTHPDTGPHLFLSYPTLLQPNCERTNGLWTVDRHIDVTSSQGVSQPWPHGSPVSNVVGYSEGTESGSVKLTKPDGAGAVTWDSTRDIPQ